MSDRGIRKGGERRTFPNARLAGSWNAWADIAMAEVAPKTTVQAWAMTDDDSGSPAPVAQQHSADCRTDAVLRLTPVRGRRSHPMGCRPNV